MKVTKCALKFFFIVVYAMGIVSLIGCNKDNVEDFQEAYVHIMQNEANTVIVNSNRKDIATYYIYYSTPTTKTDLLVNYNIEPGNGLKEGRDYQVITTENPLLFPAGIYQRPIQIRWLERELDETQDNTLSIIIEDVNNNDVAIGLPGPARNQSQFIIKKVNP